jgi:hypothetical protein
MAIFILVRRLGSADWAGMRSRSVNFVTNHRFLRINIPQGYPSQLKLFGGPNFPGCSKPHIHTLLSLCSLCEYWVSRSHVLYCPGATSYCTHALLLWALLSCIRFLRLASIIYAFRVNGRARFFPQGGKEYMGGCFFADSWDSRSRLAPGPTMVSVRKTLRLHQA